MRERLYLFTMPDGKIEMLTIDQARSVRGLESRIIEIQMNSRNKRMLKDGFEPGWQANINEHCGSRSDYNARLKELGLVEIGYDAVPVDTTKVGGHCNSLEFALHAKELGIELSDNEVDAIASGEYFDASKCDLSVDE